MQVHEISAHQHSATIRTEALSVSVRPYRDEHGQDYDEVVISSRRGVEPLAEIHGRQVRIVRVPLPAPAEEPETL